MKASLLAVLLAVYPVAHAFSEVGDSSIEIVENETLLYGDWHSEALSLDLSLEPDRTYILKSKGSPPLHGTWVFLSRIFIMSIPGKEKPEECAIQGIVLNGLLDSFNLIQGHQKILYERVVPKSCKSQRGAAANP